MEAAVFGAGTSVEVVAPLTLLSAGFPIVDALLSCDERLIRRCILNEDDAAFDDVVVTDCGWNEDENGLFTDFLESTGWEVNLSMPTGPGCLLVDRESALVVRPLGNFEEPEFDVAFASAEEARRYASRFGFLPPLEDEGGTESTPAAVVILRTTAAALAECIARNPLELGNVEWRDLERLLAEAFAGLGFSVELTPPSRDGGKDLILRCQVFGRSASYYVEVKHWQCGKRVGPSVVREFLEVVVRDAIDGGLILSSSGYSAQATSLVMELGQHNLRLGGASKIVTVCRLYSEVRSGLLAPPHPPSVLFDEDGREWPPRPAARRSS